MKTKISKKAFALQLKKNVRENREWYLINATLPISEEAKRLFFQGQAMDLLDVIDELANKILNGQ